MFQTDEEQLLKDALAVKEPVDGAWRKRFGKTSIKLGKSGGRVRVFVHSGDVTVGVDTKSLREALQSVILKMDSNDIPTWDMEPQVRPWLNTLLTKTAAMEDNNNKQQQEETNA